MSSCCRHHVQDFRSSGTKNRFRNFELDTFRTSFNIWREGGRRPFTLISEICLAKSVCGGAGVSARRNEVFRVRVLCSCYLARYLRSSPDSWCGSRTRHQDKLTCKRCLTRPPQHRIFTNSRSEAATVDSYWQKSQFQNKDPSVRGRESKRDLNNGQKPKASKCKYVKHRHAAE